MACCLFQRLAQGSMIDGAVGPLKEKPASAVRVCRCSTFWLIAVVAKGPSKEK